MVKVHRYASELRGRRLIIEEILQDMNVDMQTSKELSEEPGERYLHLSSVACCRARELTMVFVPIRLGKI